MCTVLLPPGGYPTAINKYIKYRIYQNVLQWNKYYVMRIAQKFKKFYTQSVWITEIYKWIHLYIYIYLFLLTYDAMLLISPKPKPELPPSLYLLWLITNNTGNVGSSMIVLLRCVCVQIVALKIPILFPLLKSVRWESRLYIYIYTRTDT